MAEKRGEQDGKMTNAQFEALKAVSRKRGFRAVDLETVGSCRFV
jgi:hypothetical protein